MKFKLTIKWKPKFQNEEKEMFFDRVQTNNFSIICLSNFNDEMKMYLNKTEIMLENIIYYKTEIIDITEEDIKERQTYLNIERQPQQIFLTPMMSQEKKPKKEINESYFK